MKIAIFTDCFLPQMNGVVTVVVNLVKGLADKGHKVFIIAPRYKGYREFKYKNVEVLRIASVPYIFYPEFRVTSFFNKKIYDLIKREKPDVIHFFAPMPLGLQAILMAKYFKIPLIGTFNTFNADPQYMKHFRINTKFARKFVWNFIKFHFNRCDLVTCPSESAKKEIVKNGFTKPIKVIHNAVDLKIFDKSRFKRVKKKDNAEGKSLLYIGRMGHEKNIIYLLECFKLVLKEMPRTKLVLVGTGPNLEEFKKKANELEISKNVFFKGGIPHKKLVKTLVSGNFYLFVTASTTETFGISTLEAQASGIPCVAINATGTKDIIKNGYNGYLVKDGNKKEFAKKVLELLKKNSLREKMGRNAINESKKYSSRKINKIWINEYRKLINEK